MHPPTAPLYIERHLLSGAAASLPDAPLPPLPPPAPLHFEWQPPVAARRRLGKVWGAAALGALPGAALVLASRATPGLPLRQLGGLAFGLGGLGVAAGLLVGSRRGHLGVQQILELAALSVGLLVGAQLVAQGAPLLWLPALVGLLGLAAGAIADPPQRRWVVTLSLAQMGLTWLSIGSLLALRG